MPINCSTIRVSEAVDAVAYQVNLADVSISETKVKAEEVRQIANLPLYIDQHFVHLIHYIEPIDNVRSSIKGVRNSIPGGAI